MGLEQAARQVVANGVQGTYAKYYSVPPADFEALREALAEQAEQEPVGRWNWNEAKFEWLTKFDYYKHHMTTLYAAPVRTKDLTDDEIRAVLDKHCGDGLMAIAYAVIAADRRKNRA